MEDDRNVKCFRRGSCYDEKSGTVEETGGKIILSMILDKRIEEYKKRMLCDSGCPYTLPVRFRTDEGITRIYYDITGFLSLNEFLNRITDKGNLMGNKERIIHIILDLLNKILECLKGMEDYMLFWESALIDPELIFIHSDSHQALLAYYSEDGTTGSLEQKLVYLIDKINDSCKDKETEQYLKRIKDYIYDKNPGLDRIIGMVGTLQREISYIFWDTRDFRHTDLNGACVADDCEPAIERENENLAETGIIRNVKGSITNSVERICEDGLNRGIKGNHNGVKKEKSRLNIKTIVMQVMFAAVLAGVYRSGILDITSFAGLAIILAGADLMVMRKLHFIYSAE